MNKQHWTWGGDDSHLPIRITGTTHVSSGSTAEPAVTAEDIIEQAFNGRNTAVRTLGGIARDLGISEMAVDRIVRSRPDLFHFAPDITPAGLPVVQMASIDPNRDEAA